METAALRVLLIEDNSDHATLIQRHLSRYAESGITLERVDCLAAGIERIGRGGIDAVLLDLRLPDSDGLESLPRVVSAAPQIPIVVLTSLDDLELATRAVECGAQDYLVKAEISGESLARSVRYAIERKRIYTELVRSNEDYRTFAHMVSHELKTPLSVVSYAFELLRQKHAGQLDAESKEFLELAVGSVRQMTALIDDLLAYARINGRRKPDETVDMSEVLEQVCTSLQLQIQDSGAAISQDPLPVITADRGQMVLLLQNILSNAIKYRSERRPSIHVSARVDDGQWEFSISDNGIGIEPQYVERIFVMFERLHGDDHYNGTGVGLAICKRIVERHGGRIWAVSEPGAGSVFHFTLPRTNAGPRDA